MRHAQDFAGIPSSTSARKLQPVKHGSSFSSHSDRSGHGGYSDSRESKPYTHREQASLASITCTKPTLLTKSEFEFCRQSLKRAFASCTNLQFLRFSVIISCILYCLRPLHRSEIVAIFRLLVSDLVEEDDKYDDGEGANVAEWLGEMCGEVVFIDVSGFFRFVDPSFPHFLRAVPIAGIDNTHQTIAKACLFQVQREVSFSDGETPAGDTTAFSTYAAQCWQHHYRCVEDACSFLTAKVHRLLMPRGIQDNGRIDLDAGHLERALAYCQKAGFRVLGQHYGQLLKHSNGAMRACIPQAEDECFGSLEHGMQDLQLGQVWEPNEPEWVFL